MPTGDEEPFLAEIEKHPLDVAPRLVFADWLEERGDPRCEEIRRVCRFRIPLTRKELKPIMSLAKARDDAPPESVVVARNQQDLDVDISAEAEAQYSNDLIDLSPEAIARNFPRDDRGRWELSASVMLARYDCEALTDRELYLAACSPARRKDEQVIEVRREVMFGVNQIHDWTAAPWMWRRSAQTTDEETRWGVDHRIVELTRFGAESCSIQDLEAKRNSGDLDDTETAALCTLLQDAGRFEEALQLCNVSYPKELSRMLFAEEFSLSGGCDCMYEGASELRGAKLRRNLWEAAPWKFAEAVKREQQRLDQWRAAKSGRPRKSVQLNLFIVPKQRHSRKAKLVLVESKDGPELQFDFNGSNATAAYQWWKRPVEIDVLRFQTNKP